MEVRLRKVDDATPEDVLWCDELALGSPTNMALSSWKMKHFWDEPMAPYWIIRNPVKYLDHAKREVIAARHYDIPAPAIEAAALATNARSLTVPGLVFAGRSP